MRRSVSFPRRIALVGAVAILVAACGGSSSSAASSAAASAAPGASQAPAASTGASAAAASTDTGAGASLNPIAALSDLTSYKLKLVLASSGTTGGLGAFGNISMSGTVVLKPVKAADVTLDLGGPAASPGASAAAATGMRIVEVNGKTWVDIGSGTLTPSTDTSSTSMVDSFSPDKLMGSTSSYISDMKSVGDETKNGMATTHYQADEKTLAAAAAGLAFFGLPNPKWSWDVWIAKDGGYVVSYSMNGTGDGGATMTMSLDITDVNSPSNVVATPS
jgi:hypothetical protein